MLTAIVVCSSYPSHIDTCTLYNNLARLKTSSKITRKSVKEVVTDWNVNALRVIKLV